MATRYNKDQIRTILYGSTMLGSGGGGSLSDGLKMLDKIPEDSILNVIDPTAMDPTKYIGITAGMGAPSAIGDIDFTPYAVNSFQALQQLAADMSPARAISYCMALETGGFNTFVPMLNALNLNLPFIDGDGSGRAVPTLTTLLLNVNGCNTSPLAMADGDNNRVYITALDPRNAALCETLARNITVGFKDIAGIAGWMIKQEDVLTRLVPNAISKDYLMGKIVRFTTPYSDIFKNLQLNGYELIQLGTGIITSITVEEKDGFDLGTTVIKDPANGYEWTINFQNENLIILLKTPEDPAPVPYMTAPDIICMYDLSTGIPLTNADTKEGMSVAFAVMPVAKQWWINGVDYAYGFWQPYIAMFGYAGPCLPYAKLK